MATRKVDATPPGLPGSRERAPDGVRISARLALLLAVVLALANLACGGSASSTSGSPLPSQPPGPVPTPPYYVTVTATGVTPQVTHVWQGRAVIFRNEDSRAHSFFDDQHPSHQECSGLLNLGALRPGEIREVGNLPINACFFHSDDDPANRAFWGVVVGH
jgi:hypothetical protein